MKKGRLIGGLAILDTKDSYVPCIWIKSIVYNFGHNPYTMHKYTSTWFKPSKENPAIVYSVAKANVDSHRTRRVYVAFASLYNINCLMIRQ